MESQAQRAALAAQLASEQEGAKAAMDEAMRRYGSSAAASADEVGALRERTFPWPSTGLPLASHWPSTGLPPALHLAPTSH